MWFSFCKYQSYIRSLTRFFSFSSTRYRLIRSKRTCCAVFRNKLALTLTLVIIAAILITSFTFYKNNFTCSVNDESHIFKNICDLHNHNLAFGNLCGMLCTENKIQLLNCIVHHSGKELVVIAQQNDIKMVLKSSYKHINKFDQVYFSDNSKVPVYPEMELFLDMILQSVSYYLNQSVMILPKSKIVDIIWTLNSTYLNSLHSESKHSAMSNIWHLLQQPEYVLSKLYETENVFPKVLGTCGHIYAVEFLTPIDSYFGVLHPSWRYSFSTRAKWALDLIRLFESFENNFHSVLHICDVKIGHFGLTSSDRTLRLLDLDMAYFEETLHTNMMAPSSCRSDYDCAFIDCHGWCKQGQCQSNITNNNIQRICTNIFYGYSGQDIFGLLGSSPLQEKANLTSLLLLCMKSPSSAQVAMKRIKAILKKHVSSSSMAT